MELKIKLCGIRRKEDAGYLNEFPPDYAGFVFAPYPRKVTLEQAKEIAQVLDPKIKRVGVFVNHPLEEMPMFSQVIEVYQLHGDENAEYIEALRKSIPEGCEIWKAVRVRTAEDIKAAETLNVHKLILDAYSKDKHGGTGKAFDWDIITKVKITKPFFAAGGINADNIEEAARKLKPYGVDLSGGIETDGFKDREKIKKIIEIRNELLYK